MPLNVYLNSCKEIQGRREGGGGGGVRHPLKIGRFRMFGEFEINSEINISDKRKMTAFKYIVQCYKCICSLIKENRENSYFRNDKTCHYAESMSLFG